MKQIKTIKNSQKRGVRFSKEKGYLISSNGKPFFYLADTWWYGATNRMTFPIFKQLANLRKKQGFTAIQIVIGFPPESELFSKNTQNSGGHPLTKTMEINTKYFDETDKKINYLLSIGLTPVIFGGWGNQIDILGTKPIKKIWAEIIKRYAKDPVIFSLCGEVDLFISTSKTEENSHSLKKRILSLLPSKIQSFLRTVKRSIIIYKQQKQANKNLDQRLKKWKEIAEFISKTDTHNRVLLAHTGVRYSAYELFGKQKWLQINSIQSGHSLKTERYMVNSILKSKKVGLPIINLEPWYEGITGNFYEKDQRYAFWASMLSGAIGHTYGAHGIWQMANRDNFMNHWGKSDYKKAITYKGANQIGTGKKILEKMEWWKIIPNFAIITPHWEEKKINLPLTGTIGDNYLVYIPDTTTSFPMKLNVPEMKTLEWISPITGKTIKKQRFSKILKSAPVQKQTDLLLLIHN